MTMPKFTQDYFMEFQKDPKAYCEKYGINITDADFFKKDFSNMSFMEFKEFIKKSRFSNFFDIS